MFFKVITGSIILLSFFTILFWLAGGFGWINGWIYMGVVIISHSICGLHLWKKDPELIRRRSKMGEGTKKWDVVILILFGITHLSTLTVAATDIRLGWSLMPYYLWLVGAGVYILFIIIIVWAMKENTHFEKYVRIQHDRFHQVVDSGPYSHIRHPGYAAMILGFTIGTPLLLGSWFAFLPAILAGFIMVIRTALEDRLLKSELPGYLNYCNRVRFRLIPRIW